MANKKISFLFHNVYLNRVLHIIISIKFKTLIINRYELKIRIAFLADKEWINL